MHRKNVAQDSCTCQTFLDLWDGDVVIIRLFHEHGRKSKIHGQTYTQPICFLKSVSLKVIQFDHSIQKCSLYTDFAHYARRGSVNFTLHFWTHGLKVTSLIISLDAYD